MDYKVDEVLTLAKRINNNKRSYLLINPLQAKHIPVSPKRALEMMRTLGEKLYAKYPETGLIIGFAETATAIGAAACEAFDDGCVYIHTTRESFDGEFVYFNEEHSHAVEQKLFVTGLEELISKTPRIIFIDDEISTGKTLINIAECLKKRFPHADHNKKEFICASIINRVSEENEARLLSAGIKCEYLVKLSNRDYDYDKAVGNIEAEEAKKVPPFVGGKHEIIKIIKAGEKIPNARSGVKIGEYKRGLRKIMADAASRFEPEIAKRIAKGIAKNEKLLVLGTEECMYPALVFGEILEQRGFEVCCHSTTRSPIGISRAESYPNYPIRNGYKLRSFYDSSRTTFIYNLEKYDRVIIISDNSDNSDNSDYSEGLEDLCSALVRSGCERICYFGIG